MSNMFDNYRKAESSKKRFNFYVYVGMTYCNGRLVARLWKSIMKCVRECANEQEMEDNCDCCC